MDTNLANFKLGIRLPIKEFIDFAISVSTSLVDIHKTDHIYGAICPKNIIWDKENLKAELADSTDIDKYPLLDKACLPYISPEQTGRMNRQVDYRTDLYSLGIVFYEILVGEPPFTANGTLEMIHLQIANIPPKLSAPKYSSRSSRPRRLAREPARDSL